MNDYDAFSLINFRHILAPIAVEHFRCGRTGAWIHYRSLYIFGIRIAWWRWE